MLVTSDLIIFTSRCCNCLVPKPFFFHFSYLTIVESLPTYGTHYYEVKVKKKEYFIFNLMKSSDFMLTYLILARGVGNPDV